MISLSMSISPLSYTTLSFLLPPLYLHLLLLCPSSATLHQQIWRKPHPLPTPHSVTSFLYLFIFISIFRDLVFPLGERNFHIFLFSSFLCCMLYRRSESNLYVVLQVSEHIARFIQQTMKRHFILVIFMLLQYLLISFVDFISSMALSVIISMFFYFFLFTSPIILQANQPSFHHFLRNTFLCFLISFFISPSFYFCL